MSDQILWYTTRGAGAVSLVLLSAVVVLGLAAMLVGPQGAIRQTAARPDNLRLASAIVAAQDRKSTRLNSSH